MLGHSHECRGRGWGGEEPALSVEERWGASLISLLKESLIRCQALQQPSSSHFRSAQRCVQGSGEIRSSGYREVIGPLTQDVIVQHRIDSTAGATNRDSSSSSFELPQRKEGAY
ncbi:unnamed protein product [Arctogadus glacialis]